MCVAMLSEYWFECDGSMILPQRYGVDAMNTPTARRKLFSSTSSQPLSRADAHGSQKAVFKVCLASHRPLFSVQCYRAELMRQGSALVAYLWIRKSFASSNFLCMLPDCLPVLGLEREEYSTVGRIYDIKLQKCGYLGCKMDHDDSSVKVQDDMKLCSLQEFILRYD